MAGFMDTQPNPRRPMEYAPYVAAVAALIAVICLYRRRKVRKPVHHCNCFFAIPPGGDPVDDFIHFYRGECSD